ncbi:histidine kinase dimerization/phospho-acceptor domain-containing protein [Mycolicibacterium sphagni]|uniref:histidine kinase n=1 Tax=Mycolicibacterium sphagni TaxID=1786 RepID=A0ABX2JXD5_9MYCO|nr:hypothetical protein [Mycolicibacterium sphagni]
MAFVSHDLWTPLANIRMLAEEIAADSENAIDARSRARHIEQESIRMSDAVAAVLQILRVDTGGATPGNGHAAPDGSVDSATLRPRIADVQAGEHTATRAGQR